MDFQMDVISIQWKNKEFKESYNNSIEPTAYLGHKYYQRIR